MRMTRGDEYPFAPVVHLSFRQTALGDCVATMPAIIYALKHYPKTTFLIWPPDYLFSLFEFVLKEYPNKVIRPASKIATEADPDLPCATNKLELHSTLKTRADQYAFRAIMDMDAPSPVDLSYPTVNVTEIETDKIIKERYVVFPTNFTSATRQFLPEVANDLIDYSIGLGYLPVFLGNSSTKDAAPNQSSAIDFSKGCDLRDATTMLQTLRILGHASAVVGVDNGLLHLAALTNAPVIAGFTNVDPDTRVPYRRGIKGLRWTSIAPEGLGCSPCQSKWHFIYDQKFTECRYGDYACLKLDVNKFKEAMDIYLN